MQFFGGDAQLATGPSPGEHPVRRMHQTLIDGLSLCKKNIEACILDEARQDAIKSW